MVGIDVRRKIREKNQENHKLMPRGADVGREKRQEENQVNNQENRVVGVYVAVGPYGTVTAPLVCGLEHTRRLCCCADSLRECVVACCSCMERRWCFPVLIPRGAYGRQEEWGSTTSGAANQGFRTRDDAAGVAALAKGQHIRSPGRRAVAMAHASPQ